MSLTKNEFASRPVRAASAVRISFLVIGAIASLAVGHALLTQGLTTPAMAEPAPVAKIAAEPVVASAQASNESACRQVVVEIDEGYGVRGHVTRSVCRKAF